MTLPEILTAVNEENAASLLAAYYRTLTNGLPAYTGSYFNSWAGGGDTNDNADTITADDLIAVSFLSVKIPGEAAIGILDTHNEKVTGLLGKIPANRDLADVSPAEFAEMYGKNSAAVELWRVIRGSDTGRWGVGPTKASKIMARKRPRLIPIYDSVVAPLMGLKDSDNQWTAWHSAFLEDPGLSERLRRIKAMSGIEESISDLRVMDIVLWMHGKQMATPALAGTAN